MGGTVLAGSRIVISITLQVRPLKWIHVKPKSLRSQLFIERSVYGAKVNAD
jgi:hypothetical protein